MCLLLVGAALFLAFSNGGTKGIRGGEAYLPRWAAMEPRKPGESPSSCQAAISDAEAGPSGLVPDSMDKKRPRE